MQQAKRYEILDNLPTYGSMYIPVAKDEKQFYSQGFVVRFFKSDGSDWVANFALGLGGISGVYEFKDKPDTFLVVARGECYFMTPESHKPMQIIQGGYQHILITDEGQMVLLTFVGVTIIEPNGECWQSERISFDGFKNLKLSDKILTGLSFDPSVKEGEWIPFSLNISTKEITGGSWRRYTFVRMR